MSALSPLDEILQKEDRIRALITEVRQTLKDAKRELADLRREHEQWIAAEGRKLTSRIESEVKEGLDRYAGAIEKHITQALAAINQRFDTVSAILLGEERKDGGPSLAEMAAEMRRVRNYEQRGRQALGR